MKKKPVKRFFARMKILLFVLCISGALIFTISRCKSDPFQKDIVIENEKPLTRSGEPGWDYPIKPGMESWNSLITEEERIAVLQVPENVLATLSPDDAVQLCIKLPTFFIFILFDTPQEGFDIMLERYNILRHILAREDVGGSLIAAYKDASMSGFRTLPYSNEFWTLKLFYLEMLLSQKEILQKMTPEEKLELITEARSKFMEKIDNENFASLPGVMFSFKIMATVLDVEEYEEFMASADRETAIRFIKTGWFFDGVPLMDEIFRITDNYINSKTP